MYILHDKDIENPTYNLFDRMEYFQSLKTTIYCSFDFKHFPFDSHKCDLSLGDTLSGWQYLSLNASKITYRGQKLSYLLLGSIHFMGTS